jgi:hypothetical protein
MTQGKSNQDKVGLLDCILKNIQPQKIKLPKSVKSSSSTENPKLETLYSPNKGSPKVIKSHEDSENSNSKGKSSSKMYFWGLPDLSPGIESNLNSLKRHCMTFYWKSRKDFLDYIEGSISHDFLIGFTISTRSKKSVSFAS